MGVNISALDSVLEKLAASNEQRFNAHQIAFLAQEDDIAEVGKYLLYKSSGAYAILEAKVEFLCKDNDHPDLLVDFFESEIPGEAICYICGSEYEPDLERSHVVFYFKESYLEDVKKNFVIQQTDSLNLPEDTDLTSTLDFLKLIRANAVFKQGVMHVHIDQSINNSGGNMSGNFNTGNSGSQSYSVQEKDEFGKKYSELLRYIFDKCEESKKEYAIFIAERIKEAFESGNKKQGTNFAKTLQGVVGTVASLTAIAKFFM